jgi:hypothetical protein
MALFGDGGRHPRMAAAGDDSRWWQPDGSPDDKPLYKHRIDDIGLELVPRNEACRVFLARLGNRTGEPCGLDYEVIPRSSKGGPNRPVATNGVSVLPFEAWVPATNRTETMRIGLSCGSWEDVACVISG